MVRRFLFSAAIAIAVAIGLGIALAGPADAADPAEAPPTTAPPTRPTTAPEPAAIGTRPEGVGIAPGAKAPDAALTDAADREVRLAALYENGPVLVVFYRGGWCPYCNFQVRELTEAYPEFREMGITPVVVSVDRAEAAAVTEAAYEIPFPVLSDPDLAAHRAYRVAHESTDEEVERLRGYGIDLEAASGRDHHVIAIPSMFLVDRDGIVRWAHAETDYKVRPSAEDVLAVLRGL